MPLLDGGIANIFGKAFAGLYLPATLYRVTRADLGDGSSTVSETVHGCRAQLDNATEAMRQSVGYTDTDQRILVLTTTLNIIPTTDDEITIDGRRWAIASVSQDPAKSHWEMRGQFVAIDGSAPPIGPGDTPAPQNGGQWSEVEW